MLTDGGGDCDYSSYDDALEELADTSDEPEEPAQDMVCAPLWR